MKNVLLLYPYQLYDVDELPRDVDQVLMIEDPLLFGRDPKSPMYVHRQKLVFMRATMRRYIDEVLYPAGYEVDYIEFHHMNQSSDIVNKLHHFEEVIYFDPTDDIIARRLKEVVTGLEHQPLVHVLESPNFFLKRSEVEEFFANKSNSSFTTFYRWQRERFNVLINTESYKPVGGNLMFDSETRKRLPKNHQLPSFQVFGSNKYVSEAKEYVQKHFPENPGSFEDFPWPTNHQEAGLWLDEFLEHRLDNFGPYQDAIDGQAPWVYHSALSPVLNAGLLSPQEIVHKALERHEKKEVPVASLEAFIRQVLGWREYTRGVYLKRHVQMRTGNVFNHQRRITEDWYHGTTGIPPVDDVINKVKARGYAHHIERLMVIGNIMFLCEFHPDDVYRWFMEMFIDGYDWTMVPGVYGLSQYADGGSLVTRPYASSSNYVLKMSHYERGDWCDVWDGLYWRFIDKNQEQFRKNPYMNMAISQLEKMPENRRRIIGYRAEDFLSEKTSAPVETE
jgi:deoxyribodipyrimidine photolyase-related protein